MPHVSSTGLVMFMLVDAFNVYYWEKAGTVYYWENGRFSPFGTSD